MFAAISSGFNSLHRIAEFTQIDYRTVNSLVFSLEQQGRLIAHPTAVERRHRRFYVTNAVGTRVDANPVNNQPAKANAFEGQPVEADSVHDQSSARDNQACDFGLFGIGFLFGGVPPTVNLQSNLGINLWSMQSRVTQTRTRTHKSETKRNSN